MSAVYSSDLVPSSVPTETAHTGRIVLACVLASALIGAVGFATAEDGTGWAVAGDWVSGAGLLVFVAAMLVEPLAHMIPSMRQMAQARGSLILGFVAAMAMALFCLAAPWLLAGEWISEPTIAYCILTSVILVVMLFSGHPATKRLLGAPAWHAMQRVAGAYFWTVFMLSAMGRMIGPHRPDHWDGFALLLLVATILVRFADALVQYHRSYRRAAA